MLIAGEASGDLLAAELVEALNARFEGTESPPTDDVQPVHNTGLAPRFFGAGGPRMKAAGVELAFDMTEHSVIGLSDALKNYFKFKRLFNQLFKLALERQPDAIICVDFSGFNRRFAHAIKKYVRSRRDWFHDWNPKIIQYVSPQVWASREGRAHQMARDYDLVLSIFPFEKDWYAARVPELRVEFVGHPMVERFEKLEVRSEKWEGPPVVLLLPGSRLNELKRHLPVMVEAARKIKSQRPARFWMVVPDQRLASRATEICKFNVWRELAEPTYDENAHPSVRLLIGNLPEILPQVDVAIASTGTVTMECAYFGVPTVAIYKTSWSTYQIGKRIVKVKWLAMPNILAGEEIFPEFVQNDATPENISRAALEFLNGDGRRNKVKAKLVEVVAKLGGQGASARAADAIVSLLNASS